MQAILGLAVLFAGLRRWESLRGGGSNVSAAAAVKALGDAAQKEKDYGGALESYAEAVSLLSECQDAEAAHVVAACRINSARCQSKLGDAQAAVRACDEALRILDTVDDKSLRGTALYRRAIAREPLDPELALSDASLALALGESRARPLAQKLNMQRRASVMMKADTSTLLAKPTPPDMNKLIDRFADLDTSRLAAMLPIAQQFATPDALAAVGVTDPERAKSLAAFVQRLEPQHIERWGKRAQRLLKVWRRTSKILSTLRRTFPTAVYSVFFRTFAFFTKNLTFIPRSLDGLRLGLSFLQPEENESLIAFSIN